MAADRVKPDRAAQVHACLATVMDPELDESVTELGFVTGLELRDGDEVHIGFRLPTYWCAANFAFLMADDMRRAVLALSWVKRAEVVLHDHMYAEAINSGVTQGTGFQAAFGGDADRDLDALRQTFLVKAFQRRQEALLEHLLAAGHVPDRLLAVHTDALRALALDDEGLRLVDRYLERRTVVDSGTLAFVDTAGRPIDATQLGAHRRLLRSVGVNAEFNGTLCRGLLAARDKDSVQAHPIHIVRPSCTAAAP